eukprot:scaffold79653_cov49-Attheya_sp.AAC.1
MLFKQSTVLFVLAAAAVPLGCHGFGVSSKTTTVQQRSAPLQAKSYNEDAIMNTVKNVAAAASIMGVVSASGSAAFAAPTISMDVPAHEIVMAGPSSAYSTNLLLTQDYATMDFSMPSYDSAKTTKAEDKAPAFNPFGDIFDGGANKEESADDASPEAAVVDDKAERKAAVEKRKAEQKAEATVRAAEDKKAAEEKKVADKKAADEQKSAEEDQKAVAKKEKADRVAAEKEKQKMAVERASQTKDADVEETNAAPAAAEAPAFTVPDIKVPDFKVPDFKAPDVSSFKVPDVKMPAFSMPKFDMPDMPSAPTKTKAPDFKAPEFKAPDVSSFKAPDVKMPDMKMPDVKMPAFSMPKFDMPSAPKFEMPSAPTSSYTPLPDVSPPKFDSSFSSPKKAAPVAVMDDESIPMGESQE